MDVNNEYGCLEMQKALLVLIKEFHSICKNNNIKYSLAWGSSLGAVRHKGFIPWDDDADIIITRDDYAKLKHTLRQSNILELEEKTDSTLWIPRIRFCNTMAVQGYFPTIDVFFIDNAPNGRIARKLRYIHLMALQGMLKKHPNFRKGSFILRCCTFATYILGKLFSFDRKYQWYMNTCTYNNKKNTNNTASYNTMYMDLQKIYAPNLMQDIIDVPFEDTKLCLVKNYHDFMVAQFGPDYMTPPANKQPQHIN